MTTVILQQQQQQLQQQQLQQQQLQHESRGYFRLIIQAQYKF